MSGMPTPPLSAGFESQFPSKLGGTSPKTKWNPGFSSDDMVGEDKAWSSGSGMSPKGIPPPPRGSAPAVVHESEPAWATNRRRSRRISLQLPAFVNTAAETKTDTSLPLTSDAHSALQNARVPPDKPYFPGQRKSLEGIALRSFCLGITLALSTVSVLAVLFLTSSTLWRLPFFFAALSTFHFLEFWTTAKYNTQEAEISSFLLTSNWPMYAIAHTSATFECLLTNLIWPHRSWAPKYTGNMLLLFGLTIVFVGQFIRATAMVQAGSNFNHIVQQKKKAGHELVTTGIYGIMRHPSYFGFFWWGIGTQLVLGNPICFVAYAVVLWRFFSARIRHEERGLIVFFPEDYVVYRKRVPTRIPFIP